MYLTLEIDLLPLWVSAGGDVDSGHVEAMVTLPNALHVADQVRVFLCLMLVPHHYGIIVMLCGELYGNRLHLSASQTPTLYNTHIQQFSVTCIHYTT